MSHAEGGRVQAQVEGKGPLQPPDVGGDLAQGDAREALAVDACAFRDICAYEVSFKSSIRYQANTK